MLTGIIVSRSPVQPVHHPRVAVAAEFNRPEQHKRFNLHTIILGQMKVHVTEYTLKQHYCLLILGHRQRKINISLPKHMPRAQTAHYPR
ncbi:hypothetical protein D3C76_1683990 [compost metagenome]